MFTPGRDMISKNFFEFFKKIENDIFVIYFLAFCFEKVISKKSLAKIMFLLNVINKYLLTTFMIGSGRYAWFNCLGQGRALCLVYKHS